MARRPTLRASRPAVVLAGVLTAWSAAGCLSEAEVPGRVEGDTEEMVARLETAEMPAAAAALLATDRPWRAARVLRAYLEAVPDPSVELRLLAARAEAGWGGWSRVRALLEGIAGLPGGPQGDALWLLGRARDEEGDDRGAVEAYRAFLSGEPSPSEGGPRGGGGSASPGRPSAGSAPSGQPSTLRAAARLRLGLALVRSGQRAAGSEELEQVRQEAGGTGPWIELLEAGALAATGDTGAVRRAVARWDSGLPGLWAWRARVAAAHAAGDPEAARGLAERARAWARTDRTRAEFHLAAGRAALARGDVAGGRRSLREAIETDVGSPYAREAADLLATGDAAPADRLAVARVSRAQGLHEASLEGYRRWLASGTGAPAERAAVQLEYADALFYAERYDEVEEALDPVGDETEAVLLRARAKERLEEGEEAAALYLGIAERLAGSPGGAQALYFAGAAHHDRDARDRARELYGEVIRRYPARPEAELATMRLAGLAFLEGDHGAAARLWDAYRTGRPGGPYALQATWWSARARAEAGDPDGARVLFREVRAREPDSWYALLAAEALGEPFWPVPLGDAPPEDPAARERVERWMRAVDLLEAAGFPDEAAAEAEGIAARAGRDRPTRYALGEALGERGYGPLAIRIGLALRTAAPPDLRLLRILHPFPYRTLVRKEAGDRGLDPALVAALVRRESLFQARVTSPAGARGLMQIMPVTGDRLAAAAGVAGFDPALLWQPEINVHLGTRLLAQLLEAHDGSLPAVFSAYNAGEERLEAWLEYPEAGDETLFTERIPFRETREYVKLLTRNLEIYRGLYGDGS